ncbi:MAG TPA: tRNA guanosine(34) transglycosylase Tgt, partial [Thermoanaerobaculia bacterium]|nr:tRNA guanosine(34) transglycosylase Tgt [Thermoanaerobaculia bacterium]
MHDSASRSTSPFALLASDPSSSARAGVLSTPHAEIETPCFLPVGTRGAVKGVEFDRLEAWDCRAVLANAFHLMVRPGIEIIRRAGGLHAFMGWARAILTDSGGFQVMSLASRRRITEDGVEFRSPEDGSKHFLTPERA